MSKTDQIPADANGAADGGERPGNVDKIRDILFGSQMRDYDKKFSRLEEKLLKETAELRDDLKRRFASLEAFIKGEVGALSDGQKAERSERMDAIKALGSELKESNKGWEKKANQTEEQHAKAQREMRQLVLDEGRSLSDEVQQKCTDLADSLHRESQELRALLTDRFALSDIFSEVALRLKDEFKMPGE